MKGLVLSGAAEESHMAETVARIATGMLRERGWEVDTLSLRDLAIAPCTGCFGCWVKTPGTCLIPDAGREAARMAIGSDLLVLVTPVTFGGYSSQLKKSLDRMIPLISPFFMKVCGETHHRPRYERYPRLLALGTLPCPDAESERTFSTLVARNAINFHAPAHAAGVICDDDPSGKVRDTIRGLLAGAGFEP